MDKPKPSRRLMRLLNQFIHAAYYRSLRGSFDPSEYAEIDHNYKLTRNNLINYVAELEKINERQPQTYNPLKQRRTQV